ncbi:conserved hypothetical protein [Hyella patelloides LEGE 07179]|uniref:DUF2993 domain-containing protein n=1 Tax=Hyella patelloides LEGE 07179 TaxID=945734 RepID=A0A563VMI0_9CYAN|nr:DUF2993 domain-containing protein [Hyella patelloides]VEP12622.1 conserved hypothetical protein [Hyella patelloides LEGE 07179]
MELIAIILSGFLSVFSNGGWLLDVIANNQLGSYVESAEKLAIRVDNTPNYQIAKGNVDHLRVAGQGIYLQPDLRIASLELETDSIALDLTNLSTESLDKLRSSLQKPLQGAMSIVITEEDLINALQSERIIAKLQAALNDLVARRAGSRAIAYKLLTPSIQLSDDNLITIKVTLRREGEMLRESQSQELAIAINLGLDLIQGKKIQVSTLEGTVNNRPISSRLLKGFAEGISDRLDFTTIERQGIFARLLQLEIAEDKIKIIGFARMETKSESIPVSLTKVTDYSAVQRRSLL